tara:strand:- start:868 stop:1983 length:1116 start_codon:yes stop_codon:yes gene_type:complete
MSNQKTAYCWSEPKWDENTTTEDAPFKVVGFLYWHSIYSTPKQLKKWTLDYVKNNFGSKTVKDYKNGNKLDYKETGAACRLVEKGCPPEFVQEKINDGLVKIKDDTISSRKRLAEAAKKSLTNKTKTNPKAKFNRQLGDYLFKINNEIDRLIDFPKIKKKDWFEPEDYFKQNDIKPEFAVEIMNNINPTLNELKIAFEGDDEQLVEAYDFLKRRYHTRLIEFVSNIVEVSKKYSNKRETNKKGKKKKKKSTTPAMKVKKLPYLKEFDDLGLISVDPKEIIGSTALFVYNTKSRIVYMYIAGSKGLSVQGASITGFDVKKSLIKKLRNPKHSVHMMNSITKKFAIEHIKSVKTVEKPVRERLNKNCIIVKVF